MRRVPSRSRSVAARTVRDVTDVAPSTVAGVLVVRHRQSTYNVDKIFTGRADPPLSDEGVATAAILVARLATMGFEAIVSSPALRARQTAAAVAALTGQTVVTDARLQEHDVPAWEGLTRDQIEERWPGAWTAWKERLEMRSLGAEPWADVEARVAAALLDHGTRRRRVLVIAHAGVLRAVGTGPLASPLKVGRSKGRWVRVVDGRLVDGGVERLSG
jgi:broad specificity phosphatase PhoE